MAAALQTRGVKLDPSAVTRIERGTREVKLREAVATAECLGVDLRELLAPERHDPFSLAIELRGQALACLNAARVAAEQCGVLVQSLASLLEVSAPARDNLSKLRGQPQRLDAVQLVRGELAELSEDLMELAGNPVVPIDERIAGDLQRTVVAALEHLFIAKSAGELQPATGDAEA